MKLRFHDFELDTGAFELRRAGERVHMERRPMEALIYLIERRGELVTREQLIERLWGSGVVIEFDTAVHTLMRKIRQALDDSVEQPTYLETVPRKGYRFIAPVEEVGARTTGPAPPPASPTESSPPSAQWRPWLATTLIAAAVAIGGWALLADRTPTPQRIAVLAFETLGPAKEHEYLAHGLAEDTSSSLAQLDPAQLEVVGPMSALSSETAQKELSTLTRELDIAYAVRGTLRVEGTKVRVTTNLLRADDPAPIWTATFDRELTSVLGLQRELSAAIARQVHIHVSPEREARLAHRQTDNPRAYDLYLRGRHAWRQLNPVGNREATQYYQRALEVDPNYALAWTGLAMTFSAAPINGDVDPNAVRSQARTALDRAMHLAPEFTESQFAAGYYNFWLAGRWREAVAHLRKATELDPSNALGYMIAGHALSQLDEQVEARAMMQRARELDPLFPMTYSLSSQAAFQAREYDDAREFAQQAIAMDPQFWIGHMHLGQVLEQLGEREAALAALDKSIRLSGGNSKPVALRAYTLARAGRAEEARAVLRELESKATHGYVPPYAFALIHAGLEDELQTRTWLERSLATRDVHLAFLPVDPKWDRWREHAWFESVLERCAFEDASRLQSQL